MTSLFEISDKLRSRLAKRPQLTVHIPFGRFDQLAVCR